MTLWGTDITSPAFWVSVLQVIWINILLSGDNALDFIAKLAHITRPIIADQRVNRLLPECNSLPA